MFLLRPATTSPIGFLTDEVVPSNLVFTIPDATLFLFGVLTSHMHVAWMRQVCGRLKSDFRNSKGLVYNNFVFPHELTVKHKASVEAKAQQVLDVRAKYPSESFADLYGLAMPLDLVRAHQELDRAVDHCYRSAAFPTELSRLEFLFEQYRELSEAQDAALAAKKLNRGLGPLLRLIKPNFLARKIRSLAAGLFRACRRLVYQWRCLAHLLCS